MEFEHGGVGGCLVVELGWCVTLKGYDTVLGFRERRRRARLIPLSSSHHRHISTSDPTLFGEGDNYLQEPLLTHSHTHTHTHTHIDTHIER